MLYKYFTQSSQQLYNMAVFYFTNTETSLKGLYILPKPKTIDTPQNILETRQRTSHEIVFVYICKPYAIKPYRPG